MQRHRQRGLVAIARLRVPRQPDNNLVISNNTKMQCVRRHPAGRAHSEETQCEAAANRRALSDGASGSLDDHGTMVVPQHIPVGNDGILTGKLELDTKQQSFET